jgi:integrase
MTSAAVLVSEILEDYKKDFALRGCRSVRSLKCEVSTLTRYFGAMPVGAVGIRQLRQYQADRRDAGKAAATVNKELAVFSAALNLACENEVLHAMPKFPPRLRPAPPRQGFLGDADYRAIREQLPAWGQPVLDFGYYSGWRRGEIIGLTRDEIDLDEQRVRLHPDRSKNGETRAIPLKDFGLDAITTALAVPNELGLVFHRNGHRILGSTWHDAWKYATALAGRPTIYFHDLRRSVVRRLELAGVPRKVAMMWVGHKTESIYQRYCITLERDLETAVAKMLRQMGSRSAENVVAFPSR